MKSQLVNDFILDSSLFDQPVVIQDGFYCIISHATQDFSDTLEDRQLQSGKSDVLQEMALTNCKR